MKMILILGGAGFIGSNLAHRLAKRGTHRVVVVDQFGDGPKWQNLVRAPVDEIVHPANLFYWLETFGDEVEMVYHLGGVSNTTEQNVESIVEANHNFPLLLWRWCVESETRFIYASSSEVYGAGEFGFDDTLDIEYLSNLRPLNPNGWSKKLLDLHIAGAVKRGDSLPPQWAGLRFFNLYGPNEYHKGDQRSVALKLYEEAASNVAVKLFKSSNPAIENGQQSRDFLYVKDAVNVMEWLLDSPQVSGLFNVGSGEARSFEQLATAIFQNLQMEPNIKYVDMPPQVEAQYQYKTQANIERLRQAGYDRPIATIEQGVSDFIQNYLKKSDSYL